MVIPLAISAVQLVVAIRVVIRLMLELVVQGQFIEFVNLDI